MIAPAKQAPATAARKSASSSPASSEAPCPFVVAVSNRPGEVLEGLDAHPDGISFRSPRPILGGDVIRLILHDTILVDGQVVGCAPLSTREGGYWVRARFHETSQEINGLIYKELLRLVEQTAAEASKAVAEV